MAPVFFHLPFASARGSRMVCALHSKQAHLIRPRTILRRKNVADSQQQVSISHDHTLKSWMKGNFHVQFGIGGGGGDFIADHTEVGRGRRSKWAICLGEKNEKSFSGTDVPKVMRKPSDRS